MNTYWPVCREHKYCSICRRQTKQGLELRRSMRRIVDIGTDDFECPDKLPWLKSVLTLEEIAAFHRLTDDIEMTKVVKVESNITPRFSPNMLNSLIAQYPGVKTLFAADHPLVKALDAMLAGMDSTLGCTGCRRKRLMRQIAVAVDGCTDEERRKLLSLVPAI